MNDVHQQTLVSPRHDHHYSVFVVGSTRAPCLSERRVDQVEILSTLVLVLLLSLSLSGTFGARGSEAMARSVRAGRAVLLQPRLGPVFA